MSKRLASFFHKAKQDPKYKSKARQAEVSANLRILIAESGKSFKDVAAVIRISQAALSQKLGGETNLTLDSISAIADAVGADFDIVFRKKEAKRACQAWENDDETRCILNKAEALLDSILNMHTKIQAREKTSADMLRAQYRQGITSGFHMVQVSSNDESFRDLLVANGG